MSNFTPVRTIASAGIRPSVSAALTNTYSGLYTGRPGRQQARQWRRGGNWDILGFPTALLWLDECAASAADADEAAECASTVTDLWP